MQALGGPAVSRYVDAAAPRLAISGLASSAESALPVQILGVAPAAESRFSVLPDKLTAGRFLTDSDRTAAVVGQGLVERLGLHLGARFVVTAQTAHGDVQEQLLRVAGIFRTGIREVDEGIVDVPIATARAWMNAPGAVTSVAVRLHDLHDVPAVARALGPLLPDGAHAFTWRRTSPELDAAVRVDNLGNYLFNGILLAIVALAVLEALLVAVLHRRREFGLMHAIGLSARETSLVVLGEGMMLAVVSGAAGMAVGLGVTAILHHTGLDLTAVFGNQLSISGAIVDPVFHPSVSPARALQGAIVVLTLGILSSLYPMWQASRIDVAEAMQVDQ
jgi:putative ABC transport system permease protein